MGIAMVISPVYIAEIAPAHIRGRLVTLNQFIIVIGGMVAFFSCYYLSKWDNEALNWRWMFASECLPISILLIGLIFIPESPRWLIKQERAEEAKDILTKVNGASRAEVEVKDIKESLQEETGTFGELFQPGIRTALIIAIGLAVIQQTSGGLPLTLYAPKIFMKAGYPDPTKAIGLTVLLMGWSLVCVAIVIGLVERIGRKPLLLFGVGAMAVGHVALYVCFKMEWWGFNVPLILVLTTGMSNLSISPLAWVVMAEIFPTRIRGRAMGLATFILFVVSFGTVQTFPVLVEFFEERYGNAGGVFLVLAGICILSVIFMWRMVPETKGKTLEEIADVWLKKAKEAETSETA